MQFKKEAATKKYNANKEINYFLKVGKEILLIPLELWTVFKRHMSELKNQVTQITQQLQGDSNMQENELENRGKIYIKVKF